MPISASSRPATASGLRRGTRGQDFELPAKAVRRRDHAPFAVDKRTRAVVKRRAATYGLGSPIRSVDRRPGSSRLGLGQMLEFGHAPLEQELKRSKRDLGIESAGVEPLLH